MNLFLRVVALSFVGVGLSGAGGAEPSVVPQELLTWTKRSPLKDAPPSPGLSYETSLGYDPIAKRVIRWGGHAQGGVKGSGEQISETWTLDPATMTWELQQPGRSPPASCCVQQNVFDTHQNRFLRFKAAGGNHGWQWFREIYLNNTSVWNYDLATNAWRDMRPLPEPTPSLLHCASWDSDHDVAVVFGGEGSRDGTVVYDPYTNTWTRMQPKNEPTLGSKESRSGGNMAYDAARKLHILFGSQFNDDPHTWAYDVRKNEWFDMKPATMPPTNRNDAVLAYDPVNKVVVAVVRAAEGVDGKDVVKAHLETWAYDAGKNTWTKLDAKTQPDGVGGRSRVMTFVPDQNLFLIDSYIRPTEEGPKIREHQIWTLRYAENKPSTAPLPPSAGKLSTGMDWSRLEWQPSASPNVANYVIHHGEGAMPWQVEWKKAAELNQSATSRGELDLKPKIIYHQAVKAVDDKGAESAPLRLRSQPRVVEDAVVSVISPKEVRLTWQPPVGAGDIVGYRVERAPVEVFSEDEILRLKKDTPPLDLPSVGAIKQIGAFVRLGDKATVAPTWTDTSVDLNKPAVIVGDPLKQHRFPVSQLDPDGKPYRFGVYAYRIRSVNSLNVESGPSPYFLTIPSAPQKLFSKEAGPACHLKWAPNPEQGIKGYRVYWMKGPRPEGPGQKVHRLTPDPVAETTFVDNEAGMEVRRYWVVAVDALGQEGIPSSPTWHYRTQRSFYTPFVGEWHQ